MSADTHDEARLSAAEVRLIGEALFYEPWQTQMANAVGVSRQTVAHYLREGVAGAQAAALVGLVARRMIETTNEHEAEVSQLREEHRAALDEKRAIYDRLKERFP